MKSLIYLLAGFAIGILLAPEKGADTRKKIAEQFGDAKEDGENFLNEVRKNAKAKFQSPYQGGDYTADQTM
jgi:gas vesicle protein